MNLNKFIPKFIEEATIFKPVKEDLGMVFGITAIPLFFAIPYLIFLLFFFFIVPEPNFLFLLQVLFVIFKIVLFFFLIGLAATQRARQTLTDSIKNPFIITGGFLVSTFFIIYNHYSMFTPGDALWFKTALPYAITAWLIFSIIQSRWFIKLVPMWLLWIIRVPIWIIILLYGLVFIEIYGTGIFSALF